MIDDVLDSTMGALIFDARCSDTEKPSPHHPHDLLSVMLHLCTEKGDSGEKNKTPGF